MNPESIQKYAALHNQPGPTMTRRGLIWIKAFTLSALISLPAHAATWNSDGSQSDVQAKINGAADGDIVTIPSGTFSWSGVVTIQKAVTLMGANGTAPRGATSYGCGTVNTIINGGGVSLYPIVWDGTSLTCIRVSGIRFNGTGTVYLQGSQGIGQLSLSDAPYRIDNCYFDDGAAQTANFMNINTCGPGLIDHCTLSAGGGTEFIHNNGTVTVNPGSGKIDGWEDDITPGSPIAMYIENCAFYNVDTTYLASALQSYYGARTVVRSNFISYCELDQHGSNNVGARWWEFYNNMFFTPADHNQSNYMGIRAGSGVIYNNHWSGGPNPGGGGIELYSDDPTIGSASNNVYPPKWGPGRGISLDGSDATQQLSPGYLWGNDSTMPIWVGSANIQAGRDYFVSTTQPSNMVRWEKRTDSSSTTYNYAPFTYPYPLSSSGMPNPGASPSVTPAAPTGLRIMSGI